MAQALRLLTEDEAAQELRVCTRTLRKERQAGRLPYVLIGRCVRYSPQDLETYIEKARTCQFVSERAPRSTITRSPSMVVDFEAARATRKSQRPKM